MSRILKLRGTLLRSFEAGADRVNAWLFHEQALKLLTARFTILDMSKLSLPFSNSSLTNMQAWLSGPLSSRYFQSGLEAIDFLFNRHNPEDQLLAARFLAKPFIFSLIIDRNYSADRTKPPNQQFRRYIDEWQSIMRYSDIKEMRDITLHIDRISILAIYFDQEKILTSPPPLTRDRFFT